jgi:hypothetical protein
MAPVFTQQKIEKKQPKQKGIPQEVVDSYKPYIEELQKEHEGVLKFGSDDVKIAVGRKALLEASVQLKKWIKISKVRGVDNQLKFVLITKKDYDEAQAKSAARGEKIRKARQKK